MSDVPDIHDVLHWSNRTLVAEEITRRGFRVSKETLNRWVRQRKEVPAAVERIVFELFGITDSTNSPPAWAEGLENRLLSAIEESGLTSQERAALRAIDATTKPTPVDADDPIEEGVPGQAHG